MTTTTKLSRLYILRIFVVLIAFVSLPAWPFAFLAFIPERFRWILLLWMPVGFILWGRLSRRLLVESRYNCPQRSRKIAQAEVLEDGNNRRVAIPFER
jgi:hypothetical protein